jgi:malonate-semialdehyde dehydrogenase (acetylating)/methylmalonate-semialdehyde dehydrogenase
MPALQQGTWASDVASGIDGSVLLLPRGVYAIVSPFNFPAMVPFWFAPYAIAAGNTLVVKPSEQVPLTINRIGELLGECGLPDGVFNIVHGDRSTAELVVDNQGVVGISFVGSTAAARAVHERAARRGVRVQALGGAKNHLVVMPDARLDQVVRNMVTSCFGCAGQRCMAASVIVCVGDEIHDEVLRRFVEVAKEIVVADPLDETIPEGSYVMGPVISQKSMERIVGLIGTGVEEGAALPLDGRNPEVHGDKKGFFVGPTVLDNVRPGSTAHKTEIFGPVASFITVKDLTEAIGVLNSLEYGNGASIYTQDGAAARKFKMEAAAGMIGINVGIPAPVAHLPFGGVKASILSDIKAQSAESIRFFVEAKTITERYWE